ncbi:hypothetical protein P4V37_16025 [Bacillus subtilis]|uniref:hypothetical protein n=1 Tax=Bacillus TaxID=1386 RepID=UPI0003974490|nr:MULTISPECIES: hypothetical protein [Bacillus]MBW4825277.1 hypothetical protein [Bacillaceae bacterium]MUG01717.1 hypothetical protein [Bacillus tequilensis]AJO59934.1 lipoprotein [Bacillus sp. YP1]AOY05121.1 hypothetical protein BKN48_07175 [Bacillus subtilis]ASC01127.1 hypothetical protein CD007_18050 [Bacillus subtilis]
MKKIAILMFSMLLLLSACGTAQNTSGAETKSDSQDAAAEETVTKEGTFAGLADSHTIAVTIDDKETSIQVGSDLQDKMNSISEGQKVVVKYTKDSNGALMLKDLETK